MKKQSKKEPIKDSFFKMKIINSNHEKNKGIRKSGTMFRFCQSNYNFNSTSEKSPTSTGGGMNRFYAISQLPFGCNRLNFDNVHCLYVFSGGDT